MPDWIYHSEGRELFLTGVEPMIHDAWWVGLERNEQNSALYFMRWEIHSTWERRIEAERD